jgi:hypothetical protein
MLPETLAWKNQTSGTVKTFNGKQVITKAPKSGVADLTVIHRGFVVFIELKKPNGKQTLNQKEFQREVEIAGGSYYIITSLSEFRSLLLKLSASKALPV